jgi:hypothetical protein
MGARTPPPQLVLTSPGKTPGQGLAKADPNPTGSEHCLEIVEGEADLLSIHALETTTPMLREDATTTTTSCTNIEKSNLNTNQERKRKLNSQVSQQYLKAQN